MTTYQQPLHIKAWAEEDRPREKLMRLGRRQMTDAELLAIILGSGSRQETAVALAQRILQAADNNLHELGRFSLSQLTAFKGVGDAKAVGILAATELGRRRLQSEPLQRPSIQGSRDAYNCMCAQLTDLPHEEFWILLLNRANKVIGKERISSGGLSSTVVDVRLVFHRALATLSTSIILCHNHPSGQLKPSQADIMLTRKMFQAGKSVDIPILDHLIFAGSSYYSFADEGHLENM